MLVRRSHALAAIAASGAAVVVPGLVRAQKAPIRLAYIPSENCAQVYYAQELGIFAKNGLDVNLAPMNFSAAIASAVLANSIDIGNMSTLTMTTAHSKGLPLAYVAPGNAFHYRPTDHESGIVVAGNSAIKSGKDLAGKVFGCAGLGSYGEFIPRAYVDASGGDSSTMKFVEAPNAQLGAAVLSGRVDGAFISPPALEQALKDGCRFLAVASDAVAKDFMASGWFASLPWAKAHKAEVAAFASSIHEATAWAVANPQKTIDILLKYLKLEPAVLAASPRVIYTDRLTKAALQPPVDVVARYSKFPAFSADEIIFNPAS